MGINKNFVVKNGFEVSNDLILANATTRKVGIGSTTPQRELDVAGGIGATDFYLTGIGTFISELNVGLGGTVLTVLGLGNSIGVGTALPEYLLDIRSPVSTGQTALYIQGDVRITGDIQADDIIFDDAEIQNLVVTDTLYVVGVSTIGNVEINSGSISAITYYGDGSNLTGIATVGGGTTLGLTTVTELNVIGITSLTNLTVTGVSTLTNLTVTGVSTFGNILLNPVGIITAISGIVTYYGDGQYLDLTNNTSIITTSGGIGIGTSGGVVGYGITFIDFYGAGVSTTFYDGSVGIATIFFEGGGSGTIGIGTEFPINPVNGDLFYSAEYGRIFVYYDEVVIGVGSSAFWVDAAPFNVDLSQFDELNLINLSVSNSLNATNVNVSGIVTATDFNSTSDKNLKYNVETIENALDTVNALRGVSFNWKENDRKSYGIIAQELAEVLPDLVSDSEIKTVNYNGIIGVLIEAVKELKKEIEELKKS